MTAPGTGRDPLASATAKARARLIPFVFLLYIVAYLDRINIGFAALQMNQAIGLTATTYGLGAGIFFLSYVVFEVPSNVILARVGARLWIARIMISWGLVSAATMLVQGPASFYLVRFLLGIAEAGFFPGVIFYLTLWFPARERARAIASFVAATLVAGIVGGPISGALLTMHGAWGLQGWQWLFLMEGLPAVLLGFAVLAYLPDRIADAKWLTPDERTALEAKLSEESAGTAGAHSVAASLSDGRVWLMALVYLTIPIALYGMGFWLPQIIRSNSKGSDFLVGLLSAIPYMLGAVGMVAVGRHSDRTGERRWHIAIPAAIGGTAFALSGLVHGLVPSLALLSVAMLGLSSMYGPFWTQATSFLSGVGAAAGIALINSIGNIGGFVGPYAFGYIKDTTNSFAIGLMALGAVLASGGLLALAVRDRRVADLDVPIVLPVPGGANRLPDE